jgi:predicted DNA-binding protein
MKTEQLGIRISNELKNKLEQLAEREHRTLSNYIEMILLNHIGIIISKEKGEKKFQ